MFLEQLLLLLLLMGRSQPMALSQIAVHTMGTTMHEHRRPSIVSARPTTFRVLPSHTPKALFQEPQQR